MSLQLFNAPGSPCDSDDGHVEVPVPDHRLQGREDLFIRKVARNSKEDERV